ncbi:MAG TPA: PilZ domain-containing protein [Elusimicrobiota bacterium]|nr:PilZ domain-containing protein [Elusimicrobiota bacterium]
MVLDTEHSQERRQLKRVTIKLPVAVEGVGITKFSCETLNMHEQGMAVTSTTFLTEGTKVQLTIAMPRSQVIIQAMVAWSTALNIMALKPTRCAIGFKFSSNSSKDIAAIKRFVRNHRD